MHAIYELKDKLCKELEGYGERGELSASILDTVDKLAHAIKNLDKIIEIYEMEEEDDGSYENRGRGRGSNRGSYRDGSYARRRRDSRGRYMSNYSMEGYSRHGDTVEQLRDLMDEMPNEQTRNELQRLVNKMENM